MRERLTIGFIALSLLLLAGAGFARSQSLEPDLLKADREVVDDQLQTIAWVMADQGRSKVDEAFLSNFLGDTTRISYDGSGRDIVVTGEDYDSGADTVTAQLVTEGGLITMSRMRQTNPANGWGGSVSSALAIFALLAIVAGAAGYFMARAMAAPFQQLASAAAALGRGRFELDLPDTRMPEARQIAVALGTSAHQLRERLEREREFGLRTSHLLRTPLTSLRLRLEELVQDPDVSQSARESAMACLKSVGDLDQVTRELVDSGRGVLMQGAAMPLREVAVQVLQRWTDVLAGDQRDVSAAVEGDIELEFTPGPIEQVMDLMLDDVLHRERGDVRLVFEVAADRLRIDIACATDSADSTPTVAPHYPLNDRVARMIEALGGRIEPATDGTALRVHLPRR